MRRREIAAIRFEDLSFCKEGLRLTIPRSKTDQSGDGAEIAIPYVVNRSLCAVRALREWLNCSGITSGYVFRSFTPGREVSPRGLQGQDVANLIKRLARRARLDGDFSAHSLRAGFVTSAARAKVSLDSIARTTRHKSLAVLMGYVRPAGAALAGTATQGTVRFASGAEADRCDKCGTMFTDPSPGSLVKRAERVLHFGELVMRKAIDDADFRLGLQAIDRARGSLDQLLKVHGLLHPDAPVVDNRAQTNVFTGMPLDEVRNILRALQAPRPATIEGEIVEGSRPPI